MLTVAYRTARGEKAGAEAGSPEGRRGVLWGAMIRRDLDLVLVLTALALAGLQAGCDGDRTGGPDSAPDADVDADVDGDVDGDEVDGDADQPGPDADEPVDSGPITLVIAEAAVTTERLCDLDGDGDLDNTFADLGSPASDLAVMVLNSEVVQTFREGNPILFHIPWVEDRDRPHDDDIVIVMNDGLDADDPPDPSDDRLGGESFWLDPLELDECGEPTLPFVGASLRDGSLETPPLPRTLHLLEDILVRDARIVGTIDRGGLSGDPRICAYAAIHDLGGALTPLGTGDLSWLEVFAAGGSAAGVTGVPGFLPDVDVDHDGLERFVLDEAFRIATCIDGDLTAIPGRDCWQDERMADGFSINVHLPSVHAVCLGRPDGWEDVRPEPCDHPPEESLLDPR
jgi:hypothetical protein